MDNHSSNNKFLVPASIIVAGAIIAGAIVITSGKGGGEGALVRGGDENNKEEINLRAPTKDDHIRGNINALIKIVEYSDLECPFCKRFHTTMQRIVREYNGTVAWVYRHYPLDQLHSKARKEAEATECAAALGGNEAFWKYVDRIFEITPSNNGLPEEELFNIAEFVGLDINRFKDCLNNRTYEEKVDQDLQDAIRAGGRGTPYSVLIAADGKKYAISGAQPYETVKQLIEQVLNK